MNKLTYFRLFRIMIIEIERSIENIARLPLAAYK